MAKLLPLLCALLRHRLSSPTPSSATLEGVYTQQLGGVVDGKEGEELCCCLLPLYDKRGSLDEARQPTVDAFSLLLASSQTAKRKSLDSECSWAVVWMGESVWCVVLPPPPPQVVWWSHVWWSWRACTASCVPSPLPPPGRGTAV